MGTGLPKPEDRFKEWSDRIKQESSTKIINKFRIQEIMQMGKERGKARSYTIGRIINNVMSTHVGAQSTQHVPWTATRAQCCAQAP